MFQCQSIKELYIKILYKKSPKYEKKENHKEKNFNKKAYGKFTQILKKVVEN